MLSTVGMTLQLDTDQAKLLQELLQSTQTQLRLESARADSHDFREVLYKREALVEQVLAKLTI